MFSRPTLTMVKTKEICRNSPRKTLRSGPVLKSIRRSLVPFKRNASQANIRVVVRVRPTSVREQPDNFKTVVKTVDKQLLIFDPEEEVQPFFYHGVQQKGRDFLKRQHKNMHFSFDRVFNEGNDNEDVFKDSTQGLIQSLMDGCNCSVFVYGATGAGKTYTMLGAAPHYPGITFLTMDELFKAKALLEHERTFELAVSYLEVYNESVQDLLATPAEQQHQQHGSTSSLQVQDTKFGVIVSGLQVRKITDAQELFDLLERGNRNRTQHPTDSNAESSRSHAVFQVYLRMDVIATGQRRLAKLSMIDLAGSERGAATGCKGARFTEGANINKSLLALGNCINALADGQRHVPYRDSKLTRLLKDSLGGNCHTVMIANVSPSSLCYEDTYNTLKYATRAKKIKACVQKNVGMGDLHVTQYVRLLEERNEDNERLRAELAQVRAELEQLRAGNVTTTGTKSVEIGCGHAEVNVADLEEMRTLFAERRSLLERLCKLQLNKKTLCLRLDFTEAESSRSGMYCDSPDQVKANVKSDAVSSRLQRQINVFTGELPILEENLSKIEAQIKRLLENKPHISKEHDHLSEKFTILQLNLQNAEEMAVRRVLTDQLTRIGSQLDRATALLKPCFWIARKHDQASGDMVRDYELLTQPPHSVTWRQSPLTDTDGMDSGVSSTTTVPPATPPHITLNTYCTIPGENDVARAPTPKRKQPPPDLDCTFTVGVTVAGSISTATATPTISMTSNHKAIGGSLPSLTSSSKAAMSAYQSPAAKRMANGPLENTARQSPRLQQRIVAAAQAKVMKLGGHHGTMGTAPRFASATTAARSQTRRPLAMTQRYCSNWAT